jgi:hypothetical protein
MTDRMVFPTRNIIRFLSASLEKQAAWIVQQCRFVQILK